MSLTGKLREGARPRLVLTVTEMLRRGKSRRRVREFFGSAASCAADRASPAWRPNTARPQGFFSVDDTCQYFRAGGRTDQEIDAFQSYFKAQNHITFEAGEIDYENITTEP